MEIVDDKHNQSPDDNLANDSYIKEFINEICKQLGIAVVTLLRYCINVLPQVIASSANIHQHVG